MRRVSDILASKSSQDVHSIGPGASVFEAVQLMAKEHVGALLVMEGETLIGIISERDYARKIAVRSKKSRTTPVRDIMSAPVIHVTPRHTSDDCLVLMARHQLRHLPVMQDGNAVGMISIHDLVDEIVADRRLLEVDQAKPGES